MFKIFHSGKKRANLSQYDSGDSFNARWYIHLYGNVNGTDSGSKLENNLIVSPCCLQLGAGVTFFVSQPRS